MAGTIPLSMTQQFDEYGTPLSGGQLYIMAAGTVSTPQNPFQDVGLLTPMPNPIPLDAAGRIPQFFLADGYVKVRLDSRDGVTQLTSDNILVIGPSAGGGGGGGGGGADPTTLWTTGDLKTRYDNGLHTGFVRANGRTIGSALSGAAERANADCQALFNWLWNIDTTLTVIPSRGVTSAADWSANKQIATPDWRGCAITGLDGMGNTLAGRITPSFYGSPPDQLGSTGGQESRVLTAAQCQIGQHQHNVYLHDPGHYHNYSTYSGIHNDGTAQADAMVSPVTGNTSVNVTNITIGSVSGTANDNLTALNPVGPVASPHAAIGPRKLCTIYIKL